MAINLLDQNAVRELISEIEGWENRDRKIQTWGAYRISHGDILPFVKDEIKKMLPQSWRQMRISDVSLSEKVINKLAQAYKEPPIRMIPESDTDSELVSEIYEDLNANEKFNEFDFIANLNRYALLWINNRKDGGLQFVPLHPFEFDVVRNKSDGSLECVILNYPDSTITQQSSFNNLDQPDGIRQMIAGNAADGSATVKDYALWTKDQHIAIKGTTKVDPTGNASTTEIEYFSIEDNPGNVNPLGVLPFVYFSKDDGGNTSDYPVINPITRQAIFYNVLKSDELSAASLQGFGIRILSGTSEILNRIQRLHEGLTTAVELPQPDDPSQAKTTLTFERPGPDLVGQRGSYDSYLAQVLSQHGINAGSVLNNQANDKYNSGLDRALANADVQNAIKSNQNAYARIEREAFDILKIWLEQTGGPKFSPDAELDIIYPRPQILISDKETLENIKLLLDLGLIQKHEALMKLNPNLKEDDAKAKIKEIEGEKQEAAKKFLMPKANGGDNGNLNGATDNNQPNGFNRQDPGASEGSSNRGRRPIDS